MAKSSRLGLELQKNANLITGFVAAIVLVSGISLTSGTSSWWMSAAIVGLLFMGLFIVLNARAVIKAGIATLVAVFTGQIALTVGSVATADATLGILWLVVQVSIFLLCLAASYSVPGTRSRWTATSIALSLSIPAAAGVMALVPPRGAILLSLPLSLVFFFAYYRGLGRLTERRKSMPAYGITDSQEEALVNEVEREGWECRTVMVREGLRQPRSKAFLVWSEARAYVLYPVKLSSKLSMSPGRKTAKLVHRGHSINTWLLSLTYRALPLWRSRNAPMMLVLLDVDSVNGVKPETIGVAAPDSNRKMPVGIYPAKGLLSGQRGRKTRGTMADIDSHYSDFNADLKEHHRDALGSIGLKKDSEYL